MNNLQRLILDFIWLVLNPRERSNKQISDIEKGNKRIRLHNLSRNLLVKKLARNSKEQNFFFPIQQESTLLLYLYNNNTKP